MASRALPSSSSVDRTPPSSVLDASDVLPTLTECLPHLRRYLHARCLAGGGLDADDLAQEAFLRAFSRLRHVTFHSRNDVLAYLKRVASNLLLDEYRRVGRRPPMTSLDETIAARQVTPLERVLRRERRRQVRLRMMRLPAEMRTAILLRMRGECHQHRLAVVLGRGSGAARVALSRAILRIAATEAAAPAIPRSRQPSGGGRGRPATPASAAAVARRGAERLNGA